MSAGDAADVLSATPPGGKGKPPRPAGSSLDRPKIPRPKKTSTQLRTEGRELLSARSSKDRRLADSPVEVANDPDVQAMGKLLGGAKVYILLAVCVVSRAMAVMLLKDAMEHLETPIFLVFSHQISVVVLLLMLRAQSIATVPRLTVQQLQSIIPAAIMESLEMMLFFSSLNNGSVLVVVTLTSVVSAALIPWSSRVVLTGLSMSLAWDSRQVVRDSLLNSGFVDANPMSTDICRATLRIMLQHSLSPQNECMYCHLACCWYSICTCTCGC